MRSSFSTGSGGEAVRGSRSPADSPASPARALVSTASARVREQVGVAPSLPSVPTQLVDLGLPFAAGEQGPFLARDVAAVTLTTSETGDPPSRRAIRTLRSRFERLGQLGRATEALVGSLDASVGGAFRTPDSLFFSDRVASGWAVRLTLVLCVVPFALGVFDLARPLHGGGAFRSRPPFAGCERDSRSGSTRRFSCGSAR